MSVKSAAMFMIRRQGTRIMELPRERLLRTFLKIGCALYAGWVRINSLQRSKDSY